MPPTLDESAVLALTNDGEHELHEAGTTLEPRHLQALVLIDGHATVAQVVKRAQGTPRRCCARASRNSSTRAS